jgi:DNA polymerase-4
MLGADAATRVLPPLPVTRVWGIGPATAARLEPLGIRTIGDLQQRPPEWFARHFGADAQRYFNLVRGLDDRPVEPDQQAKSIGHEQTFAQDLADADEIRRVLFDQVEQVAHRLRKHGLQARAVTLKVRFGNFQTVTRSATLGGPTDITTELWQTARDLFDRWPFQPVRLIGVTADRLSAGAGQLGLFHDPARERQKKLDGLADQINARLGRASIKRAGTR